MMRLIKYNHVQEESYMAYILEWEATEELIVPYASRRRGMDFQELQEQWKKDETELAYESGHVPSTLYFLVDEKNEVIGAIHFRHELNKSLRAHGGHIGYGIRPTKRGRGYGTLMLKIFLEELKLTSIEKVMISCDDDNVASAMTIEHNAGVMEDKVVSEGVLVRRYWIDLS